MQAADMVASGGASRQPQRLTKQQQASLEWMHTLLDQMAGEDKRDVFKSPVDGSLYPAYYQIIQEPMCFDQIRHKLAQQQYRTLRAFQYDLELIFKNAKTFNQPASNPIYKLAANMLKTVSKLLLQHEMMCRHHVYNLHPDGPAAAALEENGLMEIDAGSDAAWSKPLLCAAPQASTEQQQQQVQVSKQQPQQPRAEDLAAAHALWHPDKQQQQPAADHGLLFGMVPATSIEACLQQQRHAVLYQPFAGAQMPAQQQQQHDQQQHEQKQQQQQQEQDAPARAQQQQQEAPTQAQAQQDAPSQAQAQQNAPMQAQQQQQQQEIKQLPPPQQQQQQQQPSAEWQQARQPIAWRCQWLYLRMLELQSLISLLQTAGGTAPSLLAPPAAAAQATAAGAPVLQVQQQGRLLRQHVDAVQLATVLQSPFFAAQLAAGGHQPHQPSKPAAPAAAAAADGAAAANAMEVDAPQQLQTQQQQQQQLELELGGPQEQQQQQAGAGAPSSSAQPAAATASSSAGAQICRTVFAMPQHPSDAALLFSSLDLVEKQLVSAKLALGRAFGLDVSWAPPGVRLGQYAAARLQVSEGAAAAAAQGQKRSAAAAGLARHATTAGGGSGRALQREGSLAGSQKKRRMDRSSLGAVGAISVDDDAVMSPSASRQMTERVNVSIHIPPVREIPAAHQAALKAAATTWHAAVTAHGARHAMARPPAEVRVVLESALEAEGSSSEDTTDEAFERLHAPLLEEERVRLNPVGGGRKRNNNKLQQTNSKFDGPPSKQLQREASTAGGGAAAAAVGDEPNSPVGSSRHRAKKQGTGPAGLERSTSGALGAGTAAGAPAASAVSSPTGPGGSQAANANQSTATSTSVGAREAAPAAAPRASSPGKLPKGAGAATTAAAVRKLGLNPASSAEGTATAATATAAGSSMVSPRDGRHLKLRQQQLPPLNGTGPVAGRTAAAAGSQPDKSVAAGRPARPAAAAAVAAAAAAAGTMPRSSSGGVPAPQPLRQVANGPVAAGGGSSRPAGLTRRNSAGAPTAAGGGVVSAAAAAADKGVAGLAIKAPGSAVASKQHAPGELKVPAAAAAPAGAKDALGRRRSSSQVPDGATGDLLVSPSGAGAAAASAGRGRGRGTSPQPRGSSKSPNAATTAAAGAGALHKGDSIAAGTRAGKAIAAAATQRASRSKSKGTGSSAGGAAVAGRGRGKSK